MEPSIDPSLIMRKRSPATPSSPSPSPVRPNTLSIPTPPPSSTAQDKSGTGSGSDSSSSLSTPEDLHPLTRHSLAALEGDGRGSRSTSGSLNSSQVGLGHGNGLNLGPSSPNQPSFRGIHSRPQSRVSPEQDQASASNTNLHPAEDEDTTIRLSDLVPLHPSGALDAAEDAEFRAFVSSEVKKRLPRPPDIDCDFDISLYDSDTEAYYGNYGPPSIGSADKDDSLPDNMSVASEKSVASTTKSEDETGEWRRQAEWVWHHGINHTLHVDHCGVSLTILLSSGAPSIQNRARYEI